MKKSLTLFFLFFLAVHFISVNLYALGFSAQSKAKIHLASGTVINPVTSFENEDRADDRADFYPAIYTHQHFNLLSSAPVIKEHSSAQWVRSFTIQPLYLLNHVMRI